MKKPDTILTNINFVTKKSNYREFGLYNDVDSFEKKMSKNINSNISEFDKNDNYEKLKSEIMKII